MDERQAKFTAALNRIVEGEQAGKVKRLIVFAEFYTEGTAIDDLTLVKGIAKEDLPLVDRLREDVIAMMD